MCVLNSDGFFFTIFKGERRRKKKKKKKAKHWWDTLSVSFICNVMYPCLVVNYISRPNVLALDSKFCARLFP